MFPIDGAYSDIAIHIALAIVYIGSLIRWRFARHLETFFHSALGTIILLHPTIIYNPLVSPGSFDALHIFLLRFTAVFHLGAAFYCYRQYAPIGWITRYSRFTSSLYVLLVGYYAVYHLYDTRARGLHLNMNKFLIVTGAIDGVPLLGNLYQLIFARSTIITTPQVLLPASIDQQHTHRYVTRAIIIDGAVCLLNAIIHIAIPNQVLKLIIKPEMTLDALHNTFARLFGAYMLGTSICAHLVSTESYNELSKSTHKAYLLSRALTQALIFSLNVYGHFQLSIFSINHVTPFMISGFYITFLLIVYFRLDQQSTNKKKIK